MKENLILTLTLLLFTFENALSQTPFNEKIDRGVVALTISGNSSYIGWRLLRSDPEDISFNIYRKEVGFTDYQKVNREPVVSTTDYIDKSAKQGKAYRYIIKTIINGREETSPGEASLFMLSANQPY
jgi:rhamnogalacturonan endolyase